MALARAPSNKRYLQDVRRPVSRLRSGTGPADLFADLRAGRAGAAGHRSIGRAVRDEPLEAECPPSCGVAKMLDPGGVNQSDKASPKAGIGHSRMRIAVACGQPRWGRSVASCRSISTWVVRTSAWSQA